MNQWTNQDIEKALGVRANLPFSIRNASIDTRTLKPGSLFIALKGVKSDGHRYMRIAAQKGANAALVEYVPKGGWPLPYVLVENTQNALTELARYARKQSRAKVIAVTGSVGKTGTKEMLKLALGASGKVHATHGNFNNHLGLPLTLLHAPLDTDYLVLELGMSAAGEIEFLTQIARPHCAIITQIAPAHLDSFESITEIARAKAEIFQGLEPNGHAFIPRDSEFYALLKEEALRHTKTIQSFGMHADADCRLIKNTIGKNDKQHFCLNHKQKNYNVVMPALGAHWARNASILPLVLEHVQCDIKRGLETLCELEPMAGRGKSYQLNIHGKMIRLIDESYNASPFSMQAAIENLGNAKAERKIAILGDMLELGPTSQELHKGLAQAIVKSRINLLFACGPYMKTLYESLPQNIQGGYSPNAEMLMSYMTPKLKDGDCLLIKGSLGSNMASVRNDLLNLNQQ